MHKNQENQDFTEEQIDFLAEPYAEAFEEYTACEPWKIPTKITERLENCKTKLTVKELALHLGVAEKTIRDWVYKEAVPVVRVGRSVRFNPRDIKNWLDERTVFPA
ncbi:MAG TPA: helix-turn-helix domain-containing protein [Oligoflexia bacterium]|nr:helix-turn-helix domain-containing protein [Oligoflexia bacterium]HMR24688.1 helix-turn-helix domain-containing protein [Oligoflexia bacterium]